LRQIVEPALLAGVLSVGSAQIPFNIRDGRLRVGATTLDAEGARAILSGGYDIPADQADIRVSLVSAVTGPAASHPEIQLFAAGSPDTLDRTVDVAALSSWLAVRAIDRETQRLDSIERGEPPPPLLPASIPPPAMALPSAGAPEQIPPGRDPRRFAPKPKISVARPPVAPPNPPASPNAPVVSQQAAPLPPPIEVRPPPGVMRPKPRPQLVLTPPVSGPQQPAF